MLRKALGLDRSLRLLLEMERISWRLAYEAAGTKYGETFHNEGLALTPAILGEWVPANANVLDVGCRSGRLGRVLAHQVKSYLGIDIDATSVSAAQAVEHPPHVRFAVGDATELPAGQFDVVLLVHVLEHIDEPAQLLRNLAQLADTLIIEVPDFDRCVLNSVRLDLGMDFSSDDDHVCEYTEALLRDQLKATGWEAVEWARSPMSFAALGHRTALPG